MLSPAEFYPVGQPFLDVFSQPSDSSRTEFDGLRKSPLCNGIVDTAAGKTGLSLYSLKSKDWFHRLRTSLDLLGHTRMET